MLGPLPSLLTAPSIWYAAVLVPKRNPGGNRGMPSGRVSPTGTICQMAVEIRRGTDRFIDRAPGQLTAHAFSFGSSCAVDHGRFGRMVCHDDHLLRDGQGFPAHEHADLVIVSWVVSGALEHHGPGGARRLEPGQVAILRAGGGVTHSEEAGAPQTRFVPGWPRVPRHEEASHQVAAPDLRPGELPRVAQPLAGASLPVVRLGDHESVPVPAAPRVHVYVSRGALLRSSLAQPLQ